MATRTNTPTTKQQWQVELTLEELYKGATRKVRLNRQKVVDRRLVLEPKILEASADFCWLGRSVAVVG